MSTNCAGCNEILHKREHLTCKYCKKTYDLDCANVTPQRFYNIMSAETKAAWKCQACYCKQPKKNNTNTPIRPREKSPVVNISQIDRDNITLRRSPNNMHNDTSDSVDIELLGDTVITQTSPNLNAKSDEILLQTLSVIIQQKLKENNRSLINELQSTIHSEINKAIISLKEDIQQKTEILNCQNKQRKDEICQLNLKIESITKENGKLREDIKQLSKKIENKFRIPEINSKKIVLYKLMEQHNENDFSLCNRIVNIFRDIMNVDLTGYIEDTYRLGKHRNNTRPLVIELISKKMTKYLIDHKHLFKKSGLAISKYYDDITQKHNKLLREEMFKARQKGLYAVIKDDNLYVEGKKILWNTNTTNNKDIDNEDTHDKSINKSFFRNQGLTRQNTHPEHSEHLQ
ncbi:unnamed protein product [Parnassius mnemosyne]|uniref:Zinc finger PHD-type domain-containing protein n=1 Tax=Parnassius mnemosyne TaxID=213953 RepID=A0AAV1LST8_9NEOP